VDSQTRQVRTGLIGAGIQGSRSPAIHMNEARALGLDLVYDRFDFNQMPDGPAALPRVLAEVRDAGYLGVNITFPVKQAVLPLLNSYSSEVAELGACNTVQLQGGHATGHNTDWFGFARAFERGLPDARLDHVVLLGAGGGASAVAYALLKMGAGRIAVEARNRDRAQAFVRRFNVLAGAPRFAVVSSLEDELAVADGVVNCTPVGMNGHAGSPLTQDLLRPGLWVADLVYVPLRTELLRMAEGAGCRILEGGGMAVFQAAEAFRIFTGLTPDTGRMLRRFEEDVRAERP
jgi:shikimate dehydrogenase